MKLTEGQMEAVIAAIERLLPLTPEPGTSRSLPEIEAEDFRTNAERMRSPAIRAQGMRLGRGIAEAARKTVVSTRAKRSGMRWTPDGLDTVLALRTLALNGEFDQRWQAIREAVCLPPTFSYTPEIIKSHEWRNEEEPLTEPSKQVPSSHEEEEKFLAGKEAPRNPLTDTTATIPVTSPFLPSMPC